MADDSTFGGGLALSNGFGGGASSAAVEPGADVPPAPDTPTDAPTDVSAQSRTPDALGFGSGIKGMFGGPQYRAPDPGKSPLDQSADMLAQRIERANQVATSPSLQFFNPEGVAKARDFAAKGAEELQKIRQQQAAIKAGKQQGETLGLAPGEVPDEASQADRVEVAKARALKGDMKVFQGLQAVDPTTAEAIAPQFHEAVAGHLEKAQFAFDKLSNMRNQGEYNAAVQAMRKDGTLSGLEALGLQVPPTFDAFNAGKAREGQALREARIGVDTVRQKLEERNTYQPMEKKEAETYNGRMTTAYGDQITNGTWSRNGAAGTRGLVVNGAADPRTLGKDFTLATPEQRKAIEEESDKAVPKEEREKARAFNRTYKLATTNAKGEALSAGQVNTNPNVQQGMAEGLASMLRGGNGGANVGLLKIETGKRGFIQSIIDKVETEHAATINELKSKDVAPYLSKLTQQQIRDVMDVLKQYNDVSINDRVGKIAERAGALGLDAAALGYGDKETAGGVQEAIERGRQAQIARMTPQHQAIGGGDGVFQLGAQRPGASATGGPAGSAPTTQLPGAPPVATPVQQAQQPPAPVQPVPPPTNGGGAPPTAISHNAQQPSISGPAGGAAPTASVAPPTGGPTPGRFGLPPNMPLNNPQALDAAANRTIQIESGFKPGQTTGSYRGFGQWSDAEMKRHGITDPNDLKQTQDALKADITARAAKLQKDGLPVTASNVYLMHQQGEAGLEAHLRNPDGAAWESIRKFYKSDAIAKQAVWGNMTPDMRKQFPEGVGSVKSGDFTRLWAARYDGTDNPQGASVANVENRRKGLSEVGRTAPRAEETPAPEGKGFLDRLGLALSGQRSEADLRNQQDAERTATLNLGAGAVEHAPAIGSAAGATIGTLAGPAGTVAGGAAGGGAGQALKDYLQGRPFNGTETAKQAALGGVLGVMPEARAIAGLPVRAVGAGAVEAGAKAAEGGDAADIADAGVKGATEAGGGELFGRTLGMALHKTWQWLAPDAKKVVQAAAEKYHNATETLRTEEPKLPGVGGAASTPNPKYEAAERAKTEAETAMKDVLPTAKPEELAYAHKVTSEGVPKAEAEVNRPGAVEQATLGKGYDRLRQAVDETGVGAPKAAAKLADGPRAAVENKQVSAKHAELAERTEMAVTAPAGSWGEKWQQLVDARSSLLQAERDAMASTSPGKTQIAADMRTLADTVRAQQAKTAEYVFGKTDGPKFMEHLKTIDVRYRKLMEATNNGDMAAAARMRGEEGREVDRKFRAFAHDDPTALAAWDAMRRGGSNVEKDVRTLVGVEKIPYLGKLVSGAKMIGAFREYVRDRAAGAPVKFADLIGQVDDSGKRMRDVAGSLGARTAAAEGPLQ